MKANELRIGNFVNITYVLTGKIRVSTIGCQDIVRINDNMLQTFNYEPIPITEQWLLKLGLWIIDNNKYRFNNYIIEYVEGWDMYILQYIKSPNIPIQIGKELKYVHQVQNTLFWLTDEKLEHKSKGV